MMTPEAMRAILRDLGWSQRGCAREMGVHEATVRKMARGKRPITDDFERKLLDRHEQEMTRRHVCPPDDDMRAWVEAEAIDRLKERAGGVDNVVRLINMLVDEDKGDLIMELLEYKAKYDTDEAFAQLMEDAYVE